MFWTLLSAPTAHQYLVYPNYWPTIADFITWCRAMDPITGAVLIVGGFLFLFSGFKMHRMLVATTAAVIGAYLGAGLAMRSGMPILAGAPIGAILFAILAWFATAWTAAAVGAICGAFIGAAAWTMFDLDPRFTWSGALTGAVTLGLLCFIIFRVSVIMFTSLQGSVMLVMGVVGLAYQYPFMQPHLDEASWRFVLPSTVLTLMLVGLGWQYLKGPGGGGGSTKSSSPKSSPPKKEPAKAEKD